ncbi:hypothetical protein FXO12_01305 [Pseudomonas sp. J380]|nr:hypothetical protein [Pseudomonas lactis]QHA95364.1 hypothetical protein FXO12_01305 [Pseudomonas sp. J380]
MTGSVSTDKRQACTASLLDSASATALDCGELLDSPGRAKMLAVWHL